MKAIADVLPQFLRDDAAAIDLNLSLYQIAELWDDLIDGEKTTPETISAAFYSALVTIPRNPFYQKHFSLLSPLVETAILDWFAANALEKKAEVEGLRAAYILRCGLHSVTVMCARIIGGLEWANAVNLELRTLGDTWADYAKDFGVN